MVDEVLGHLGVRSTTARGVSVADAADATLADRPQTAESVDADSLAELGSVATNARGIGHKNGKAATDELRFGILGYGYWGPHLVRNVDQLEHSRMELICDPDESRLRSARASFRNAAVVSDVDAILGSDVDGVFIATPMKTHYEL